MPPVKSNPASAYKKTAPVLAKVGGQGRLTLPRGVRDKLRLEEGQVVEIQIVDDDTFVVTAKHVIDRHQAWVWTKPWLAGLSAAQEDLAAGRVTRYDTDEDFLDSLDG